MNRWLKQVEELVAGHRPYALIQGDCLDVGRRLPDELMLRLVRHLVPPGGIVYDPCAGSGSTGAAAVAAGYRFLGVELDDNNHRIASERLRQAARSRPKAKLAGRVRSTPLRRAVA